MTSTEEMNQQSEKEKIKQSESKQENAVDDNDNGNENKHENEPDKKPLRSSPGKGPVGVPGYTASVKQQPEKISRLWEAAALYFLVLLMMMTIVVPKIIAPKIPNPCLNGGVHVKDTCLCPEEWIGTLCHINSQTLLRTDAFANNIHLSFAVDKDSSDLRAEQKIVNVRSQKNATVFFLSNSLLGKREVCQFTEPSDFTERYYSTSRFCDDSKSSLYPFFRVVQWRSCYSHIKKSNLETLFNSSTSKENVICSIVNDVAFLKLLSTDTVIALE